MTQNISGENASLCNVMTVINSETIKLGQAIIFVRNGEQADSPISTRNGKHSRKWLPNLFRLERQMMHGKSETPSIVTERKCEGFSKRASHRPELRALPQATRPDHAPRT